MEHRRHDSHRGSDHDRRERDRSRDRKRSRDDAPRRAGDPVVNTLRDIRTAVNYQNKLLEDQARATRDQNRLLKQLILALNPDAKVDEPTRGESPIYSRDDSRGDRYNE